MTSLTYPKRFFWHEVIMVKYSWFEVNAMTRMGKGVE